LAPNHVVRKLAAIVAADVAGYSRLMAADEEGTLERLKAHREALIDPKIAEYSGRIIKTTGDGLLAEFASAVDAVRSVVEIQRGMMERNARVPRDKRMDFRIGVNIGDVIVEGDDIFGHGVNLAARLEGIAEAGGVMLSEAVRDQVRDKLDVRFDDLGQRNVKNIPRPVHAYRIRLTDGGWRWRISQLPGNAGFQRLDARIAVALALLIGASAGANWYFSKGLDAQAPAVAAVSSGTSAEPGAAPSDGPEAQNTSNAAAENSAVSTTALAGPQTVRAPPSNSVDLALVPRIRAELRRLGCYAGPDVVWDAPAMTSGVARYTLYARLGSPPKAPTLGMLQDLKGRTDRLCPLECSPREVAVGGRCVFKVWAHVNDRIRTRRVAPSIEPAQEPATPSQEPIASTFDSSWRAVHTGACPLPSCGSQPIRPALAPNEPAPASTNSTFDASWRAVHTGACPPPHCGLE
jgi:class 3 adenylate cyclase